MSPSVPVPQPVVARPLRRPGGLPPLFLISAPEVNALGYVALSRCLPAEESPYDVQARRGAFPPPRREYEPEEIAALGAAYLAAIRAVQPEGPYLLAGMCAGGHIAFEIARRLESGGERVALLALLDTWPVENSSRYPLVLFEALRGRLRRLPGEGRLAWVRRIAGQAARLLAARLGRDPARPASTDFDRWRARVWPGRSFVPPRYRGEITVLAAGRQAYYRLRDPTLGWAARSDRPVQVHILPGDHQSLLRAPNVGAVAEALAGCVAEARELHGRPAPARATRRLG